MGLYEPAVDAATGRLELLRWLEDAGFTIDEMVVAFEHDSLGSLAGSRRLLPGTPVDGPTAADRSGLSGEDFAAISTALGFVPLDGAPGAELAYTDAEIAALAGVSAFAAVFDRQSAIGLIRVLGSALERFAEAAVSVFLNDVEAAHVRSGQSELVLAQQELEAIELLDGVVHHFDPILRRHLLQASERTRRATVDNLERFAYRYAVGFVDLVGFTAHSRDMAPRQLAAFMGEFEGHAHDVVTQAGARVVKLIGDEVMFVSTDPAAACRAGQALMDAFGDASGVVPRCGLAYGDVVPRSGDYYGATVNLASRLVDEAVPLEVLVTADLARAADNCRFESSGRRMVKGFDEPIAVRTLLNC